MDLKPYFDAAHAANEEVQAIIAQVDAAFKLGTDEGNTQALELRPALDAAHQKALDANALYVSIRDADATSSAAAKMFVPVVNPAPESKKTMSRAAFEALDAEARSKFFRGGGKLVENEE
jgi:hypothetical protein